jgi:hypothetical protein
MLMALEPATGLVLARWDKWPSVWWSGRYFELGGTLFEAGFTRTPPHIWIAPSTNRIEIGRRTPEYVEAVGRRIVQQMNEDRHAPCYRIDLQKLLPSEEPIPLEIREIQVAPRNTALIRVMLGENDTFSTLLLEINQEVEVVRAEFPRRVSGEPVSNRPGTSLEIPEGLVYLAQ